jgi:hypothetical protein
MDIFNWNERRDAQHALRDAIIVWGGVVQWTIGGENPQCKSQSEAYREFYRHFKVDVLSAQSLSRPEAELLINMIDDYVKIHVESEIFRHALTDEERKMSDGDGKWWLLPKYERHLRSCGLITFASNWGR